MSAHQPEPSTLPPLHVRRNAARPLDVRVLAGVMLACTLPLLAVAMWLRPEASRGVGTHEQLGLPPCSLMRVAGIPCPTCGMTTSFALAVHGHVIDAVINQPAGGALAIITAATALLGAFSLITGKSLAPIGRWLWRPRFIIAFGVFMLLAWAFKVYMVVRST